jgi:hypothetical protein
VSRRTVRSFLTLIVVSVAFASPAAASAATVVNGNFETGTLAGWQQFNQTGSGDWFTYEKEGAEEEGFFPPPSGTFAAADDQNSPDLDILYQDITLEPGFTHQLALTFYYRSEEPIVVPSPEALALESGVENQHVRVDVVTPTAPIDSVSPSAILTTLFANKNGDPEVALPTRLTADLSSFAGQTVRLRIANSVTQGVFNTGLDDVSITSSPLPPPPPPSNAITRGKLSLNKRNGTGKMAINVPGPGTLIAVGKGKKKKLKRANLTVTAAGTVKLPLNPNGAGKKLLNSKGKLKTGVDVTFTPTGGTAVTQAYKVTLKKTLAK